MPLCIPSACVMCKCAFETVTDCFACNAAAGFISQRLLKAGMQLCLAAVCAALWFALNRRAERAASFRQKAHASDIALSSIIDLEARASSTYPNGTWVYSSRAPMVWHPGLKRLLVSRACDDRPLWHGSVVGAPQLCNASCPPMNPLHLSLSLAFRLLFGAAGPAAGPEAPGAGLLQPALLLALHVPSRVPPGTGCRRRRRAHWRG